MNSQKLLVKKTSETIITPAGRKVLLGKRRERFRKLLADLRAGAFLGVLAVRNDVFGLSLGRFWLILEPALQALTYYIVLKYFFRIPDSNVTFVMFFAAITFWRSHAAMMTGSGMLLVETARFSGAEVSIRVPYTEFLLKEAIQLGIRIITMLLFIWTVDRGISVTDIYFIYIAVLQLSFSFSLAIWISIAGGFLKDTSRILSHFVWLWWFMSPGLYTLSSVPDSIRWLYELNPFAHFMPAIIDAAVHTRISKVIEITAIGVGSIIISWFGMVVATKVRQRVMFRI